MDKQKIIEQLQHIAENGCIKDRVVSCTDCFLDKNDLCAAWRSHHSGTLAALFLAGIEFEKGDYDQG